MTTPAHNEDHRFLVVKAAGIMAAALGPVVADMATAKGFDRYQAGDGGDRLLSTLADTSDASEVVKAMLDYWAEAFQPYFGHPGHLRVRQMVYNVRSIRNYYVGRHPGAECDYEPYLALGQIAILLRRFSADEAARQVNELMGELGNLMYGQPTAATPSAGGDNIILTRDALAMLIADAVSQEVARQLRSEPDRAGWHSLEDGGPPTPNTTLALPSSTVSPVVASSEADATPVVVPASAIEDAAPVSAENARLANDAFNRGNAHVKQGDYDQAVAEYTAAIETDPQNAYAYYIIRGYAYGAQGNYHLAIADYTAAIGLNSQIADAYMLRGLVYGVQGGYDQAIADYTAAIDMGTQDAQAYYNRGIAYAKQGEYDQAIADYTAAIGLNPQFAESYMLRGLAYGVQGKYDQAVADNTAAIGLNPQLADAYMLRGFAYDGQGEYDLAVADYTAAIDLDTQDAQAYNHRGRAYAEQGEYDLAIEDYFAAIELDPEFAQAYNYRGRAYAEQGEYDLAIEDYFAAIELDPEFASAYFNRGVAYVVQREFDWAVADYTVVIGLNPQDASAYLARGVAYFLLGECERAIEDIDRAISMSPDSDTYSEVRDHVVRLCGDSAEYDQAIDDDPDDPANWHLRGLYYSEREEYVSAVDDYTQALEMVATGGDAAEIYSDRGLAWARLGDDERAMADFDRAIEGNPNLAEAWYNRGLAWRRRGEHGNAVLDFTRAIGVRPDYALAYYGRSISHGVLGNGEQAAADFERARELGFQA